MPSVDSSTKMRTREGSPLPSTHSNVNEEIPEEIKSAPFQPESMEENVTILHGIQYKSSFILRKVRMLLKEVVDRAERPAFKLHISIPPRTLENETCTICWDAIEPDRANLYGWEDSHSEVVTSCGHIFGEKCLWTWLSYNSTRSCPTCRKNFNQVSTPANLAWKSWSDLWQWYVARKQTMPDTKRGRHLWDGCSMEELRAQFDMQDDFPIQLEHLVYIVLDINLNLWAVDHLSTKNIGKYMKRTRIVVEGLCHYAPEPEALEIKTRVVELVPFDLRASNRKVGTVTEKEKSETEKEKPESEKEKKPETEKEKRETRKKRREICAGLLNLLHASVKLFEKHVPHPETSSFYSAQVREMDSVKLDDIQAASGTDGRNRGFTSNQELWEHACSYVESDSEDEFSTRLRKLRLEQIALLKMAQRYSQKVISSQMPSMAVYLMGRMAVINCTFEWFWDRLSKDEVWGSLRRELVEGNSQIIQAFDEFKGLKYAQKKISVRTRLNRQFKAIEQTLESFWRD